MKDILPKQIPGVAKAEKDLDGVCKYLDTIAADLDKAKLFELSSEVYQKKCELSALAYKIGQLGRNKFVALRKGE